MKVINDRNEILDASVSIESIDGIFGVIFESRGGRRGSKSARNTDYYDALEILILRLKKKSIVKSIEVFLVSSIMLIKPVEERLVKIDGEHNISLNRYSANELRKKISLAISKMKENEASMGGNPTKRILISTNLTEKEWAGIISNNIVNTVPEDNPLLGNLEFNPPNTEKEVEKIIRAIALRRGQPQFRKKLIDAYGGKCAITNSTVLQTLQAAHIYPYEGAETNHITNGILLRSDVHDLFDLHLIGINEDYEIIVGWELLGTEYEKFNGKTILLPNKKEYYPSKAALKHRPIPKRVL